jgi:hypothetical protein
LFVFIVSELAGRKHVHIVDPSEVEHRISRLAEEGHTGFAVGSSQEEAVPFEEWQPASPQ